MEARVGLLAGGLVVEETSVAISSVQRWVVTVASLQVGGRWASLLCTGLEEEAGVWGMVLEGPLAGGDV